MAICNSYNFPIKGDQRGSLVVMDKMSGVPFDIKRLYYIFGTNEGVSRGFHAHKTLHQLAVCISGSCRMVLDNGKAREDVWMNNPSVAIDLPPMLWHEMHDFSENCVLLLLASDYYDESDYIRDYRHFKTQIAK